MSDKTCYNPTMPTDLDVINESLQAAARHQPAGSSKGGQFMSGGGKGTGSVSGSKDGIGSRGKPSAPGTGPGSRDKTGLIPSPNVRANSLAKANGMEKNADFGGHSKSVPYAGKTVTAGVRPSPNERGKWQAHVPTKRGNTVKTVISTHSTPEKAHSTVNAGVDKLTKGKPIKPKSDKGNFWPD